MKPITITALDYHRNGVSGEGFYVALFNWRDLDDKADRSMVAILFDEPGQCAVLDTAETAAGNVTFAQGNSWRGDRFEPELRAAIKARNERED
jgi:hypothetical protein